MKSLFGAVLVAFLLTNGAAFAAEQTTTLQVKGMSCASCVYQVNAALRKVDGVSDVKVLGRKNMAIVKYDDAKCNAAKLALAATNAGFPSKVVKLAEGRNQ